MPFGSVTDIPAPAARVNHNKKATDFGQSNHGSGSVSQNVAAIIQLENALRNSQRLELTPSTSQQVCSWALLVVES
jgi:hypothetical protein